MILNFDVGRDVSLKALDEAMLAEELVFLTSQKAAEVDEPTEEDFYHVGTICKVKQMIKLPGETVRVLVEGISRGRAKDIKLEDGYFKAVVEEVVFDAENSEKDLEIEAFVRNVFDAFEEYINIGNKVSPEILISLGEIEDVDRFIDTIAANVYLKPEQKQQILEEFDINKRLELIYTILLEEIDILKIEKKITLRVKKQMNKVQKEYYLREQLRAIQKELGEEEDIRSKTSFSNKTVWQRFQVIAAGPIMNFLLALVLFIIIALSFGVAGNKIDVIDENSNEYAAGMRSGDKIVSINGKNAYFAIK